MTIPFLISNTIISSFIDETFCYFWITLKDFSNFYMVSRDDKIILPSKGSQSSEVVQLMRLTFL